VISRGITSRIIPQADHIEKLFDVVEVIAGGKTTKTEIALECGISERQAEYYRLAGISVNLLRMVGDRPYPTGIGRFVVDLEDEEERRLVMKPIILLNPAVRLVFDALREAEMGLTIDEAAELLRSLTDLSAVTCLRRTQTIFRWLLYCGLADRRGNRFEASDFD
jgi:hypothetical protein